jgi:dihydroorotate dehydrogenase (NAD+) catalytic subunit
MSGERVDLSVTIGKLTLKNPVMPASGTFGYGEEFADFFDLNDLGAVVAKGTTFHPRMGNPPNRFVETSGCSFLTFVGLQNVGVHGFVEEKLPYLRRLRTPVIVNVAGDSVEEFGEMSQILTEAGGVSAIEVNLACPNVSGGGASFSADARATFDAVRAVRQATDLTVIAKLLPTVVDVRVLAKACVEAGADAICPIAGPMGMAIDINTRRSKLGANLRGALGGPALKPVHLRLAWEVADTVSVPVIGCGGITCAEDALEYLIAGASAVEVGAASLTNPKAMIEIIEGIEKWLAARGIGSVKEIIGTFIRP